MCVETSGKEFQSMGIRVKGLDVETGDSREIIVEEASAESLEPRVSDLEAKVADLETRVAALEGAAP
jgi:uncharacterized protein YceH (UPF0502 family)